MSFRDLGSRTRSRSGGPQHNRSVAVEYEDDSQSSHHVPMKKKGSDGTTSTGMSEGSTADEGPSSIGEIGIRRHGSGPNGLGNNNEGSLNAAVARVSSGIARYQRAVADYEKAIQTNYRGFAHEKKLKVLLDGANGASSDVSGKLSDLDSAIRETRGPFGGDELTRAKASHSKLSRDYQRIRSAHDGLLQRSSETAKGSTGGNAVTSSSGNDKNLWSHDEPPLESLMHGGDKAELITEREEEYSKQVMQSREDDIQQINQKMNKVNEIYKDLGNLVGSQQDQIDEIEDAAADADSRAATGLDQLQRANRPWFGGKKQEQQQQEEEAAEKSWSDSIMDSMKEMKSDMDAIGNDVAKKSKASILAAQMMFCGAFGGASPYGASSD